MFSFPQGFAFAGPALPRFSMQEPCGSSIVNTKEILVGIFFFPLCFLWCQNTGRKWRREEQGQPLPDRAAPVHLGPTQKHASILTFWESNPLRVSNRSLNLNRKGLCVFTAEAEGVGTAGVRCRSHSLCLL